jgi:hypothetical protein
MEVSNVEQVAFAFAVCAAETVHWFAFFADCFGKVAFFGFVSLLVEHFDDSRCAVVEQVVYVPEQAFLFCEVAFYSLFQISLSGANVSVYALFKR